MTPSEIKSFINKLKSKLGNMLYPDSDKAMQIRKTIGELLLDLGIPALNFSPQQMGFVLDHLAIPDFDGLVDKKLDDLQGLINRETGMQLVLKDYLNPPKKSKPELEPEAYTNNHIVSKDTMKKLEQIKPEIKKVKQTKLDRKLPHWRVMPYTLITGNFAEDMIMLEFRLQELFDVKDRSPTKDGKFYEVIDMIKQYQFAIGDVQRKEVQRMRDLVYEKKHDEQISVMNRLIEALESEVKIFDDVEFSMTQKGLDAGKEIATNVATGTGIPLEIVMGKESNHVKEDPLKDDFMTQLDEANKKRQKREDIADNIQFGGHDGFQPTVEIGTIKIPARLLVDSEGKSIAFKNLSPDAQSELRSLRAQKAANTRRRNKILSGTEKISHQPGDKY